jgi:hypothetical protein
MDWDNLKPSLALVETCSFSRTFRLDKQYGPARHAMVDADGRGAAVVPTISVASLSKKRHYSSKSDFLTQGFYSRPISVVLALQRFAPNRSGP